MKNPPTQEQINAEIAALEACKAYIPKRSYFGEDNHKKIDLQIQYLKGEIDPTDEEEWEDYSEDQQGAITEAQNWKEGDEEETPSSGWDQFKLEG